MPRLQVPRLYAIADASALAPIGAAEAVERLAALGVEWIQLRGKDLPDDDHLAQARRSVATAKAHGALLWINDRADIALASGARALHLGQEDVAPGDARRLLGSGAAIGLSTHTRGEIEAAAGDPAVDVVAVGPVFATASKPAAGRPVGLELLRWARGVTSKPLVAIGGITAESAPAVLAAGADSVAAIGALGGVDLESSARALLAAVRP